MLAPTKLYLLTATQIVALLSQSTIAVEDHARALLSRIDERDSIVKAWVYLGELSSFCYYAIDYTDLASDRQQVLYQARALDQILCAERKPLHGVGAAIKDAINTESVSVLYAYQ